MQPSTSLQHPPYHMPGFLQAPQEQDASCEQANLPVDDDGSAAPWDFSEEAIQAVMDDVQSAHPESKFLLVSLASKLA